MQKRKKNRKSDGKKAFIFFGIVFSAIILDQLTKWIVTTRLADDINIIDGILKLSYIENPGAGFGILQGSTSLLAWFSVIVIGAILLYYDRIEEGLPTFAFALITGGAIGNLIDRMTLHHVVDFIDFSFFPAFNVADSCITMGGVLLIIYMWQDNKK